MPKIRTDLVIQEMTGKDGTKHYVIKDPITNAYFKAGEPEYFIIRSFDGTVSVPQIISNFKEKFNTDLAKDELEAFVSQLQEMCFLDNDLTKKELLKKQKEASIEKPRTLLGKLVFIPVRAFNPGKLFDRLINYVRPFFTRKFVWFAVVLIVFSFILSVFNVRDIADGLISMINIKGLIILYMSMFVIVLLHEFAHGLTCRYFGGKVNEIGFLFIYFQPAFYCNVSDAWLFPEKYKKLLVTFAGGFFQIFIWALSVIVWRVTAQDVLINKFALAFMAFSGIATLFNFNPLMRYDGYYMLSDYLEIPNLRQKARNYWNIRLRNLFRGTREGLKDISGREQRIYFYYGILSFIYIVFILGFFFIKVGELLIENYGGTGFIIFAAIMVFLFRNIIVTGAKETAGLLKRRRPLIITAIIVAILVLVSVFVPLELRIKGELVITPSQSLVLKYDNLGYAQLLHYDSEFKNPGMQREISVFGGDYTTTTLMPLVHIGEKVKKGQIIARLANTETTRFINEYSAQLEKVEEELAILKQGARPEEIEKSRNTVTEYEAQLELSSQNLTRMNEMKKKEVIATKVWEDAYADSLVWASRVKAVRNELNLLLAGSRPEEIRAKEAEIARLKGQLEFHRHKEASSEIESTIDGTVLMVDTGLVACEIAPLDTLAVDILLSEKELSDIALKQAVKFKIRGYPALSFYGTLNRIDNKITINRQGDPVIKVTCKVGNQEGILKPGMTGVANVYCGKRKISHLIYRKFFRTIRTEFWDWFDWL